MPHIVVPESIDQAAAERLLRDLATRNNALEDQAASLREANQRLEEKLASRPGPEAQAVRYMDGEKALLRGFETTSRGQKIGLGADTNDVVIGRSFGYLDDPDPKDDLQREIQRLVDARSLIRTMQQAKRATDTSVKIGTPQLDAEIRRLAALAPAPIARAFIDSAGVGGEWIPTDTMPELDRAAKLYWDLMLPGFFPARDIARDTLIPLVTQTFQPYQHGVTGDDPAQIVKSSIATSSTTTALKTLAGRTQVGMDAAEESILPAVQELRDQLAYALTAAVEDAMINSDTAGTHQDTGFTSGNWNPGSFWPANLSGGSNSHLRAFLGIRANAIDNSNTVDRSTFSFGTLLLDLANIDGPRSLQGYVLIGSKLGLAKNLYGLTEVKDMAVFGANATNIQGVVRNLAGIGRVYESPFATDDLTAVGIFDNVTTTYTAAHLVNVNRWRVWRRYGIRLDMQMDATRGIWELVAKTRMDFKALVASEKSVRSLVKMAKS
jgi:hypothetical protein